MDKITTYQILSAESAGGLETLVQDAVAEGKEPLGGLIVLPNNHVGQAVIGAGDDDRSREAAERYKVRREKEEQRKASTQEAARVSVENEAARLRAVEDQKAAELRIAEAVAERKRLELANQQEQIAEKEIRRQNINAERDLENRAQALGLTVAELQALDAKEKDKDEQAAAARQAERERLAPDGKKYTDEEPAAAAEAAREAERRAAENADQEAVRQAQIEEDLRLAGIEAERKRAEAETLERERQQQPDAGMQA